MSSSAGAASAAPLGRGNRSVEVTQDYSVVFPSLPSGSVVLNTASLHTDVKGWPYRVEDLRDELVRLRLLNEVTAIRAYQVVNHVWPVTFKSAEGKKKIRGTPEIVVKSRRCIVIDPDHQDVRVKLHWLLFGVADDDVRAALAPYRKLMGVTKVARRRLYERVKGGRDLR